MTRRTAVGALALIVAGAIVALAGRLPAEAASVDTAFTDDDWTVHEAYINALRERGITKGCNPPANTRFCPTDPVTRGEMAAFLVRAFEYSQRDVGAFTDDGGIFEAAIEKLAAAGVTKGCNPPANTRFCPDQPVTRAQVATMLARALGLGPLASGPFTDVDSSVHREAINAIADAGITKGCNPPQNTRFCPEAAVTRAEMATMLIRALGLTPIPNRLVLAEVESCNKGRTACSSAISVPPGASFVITEGWYQALPYVGDERVVFESEATRFELTLDGRAVATTLSTSATASLATREWRAVIGGLEPGRHTLRATWRWDGALDLVETVTVTVGQ